MPCSTPFRPRLVATELLPAGTAEPRTLAWAAALAAHSDHPVSRAIALGLDKADVSLDGFTALAGRGVQARMNGGMLTLGNHRMIEERKLCSAENEARLEVHEAEGRTVTLLASDTGVLAIFAVADTRTA